MLLINVPSPTTITTPSQHDALPISGLAAFAARTAVMAVVVTAVGILLRGCGLDHHVDGLDPQPVDLGDLDAQLGRVLARSGIGVDHDLVADLSQTAQLERDRKSVV